MSKYLTAIARIEAMAGRATERATVTCRVCGVAKLHKHNKTGVCTTTPECLKESKRIHDQKYDAGRRKSYAPLPSQYQSRAQTAGSP